VAETVTISIGGSSVLPTEKLAATWLLDRADKALYQAKEEGRNTFRMRPGDE
jgi:two-component system chemotaxis family response regulator WspR